MSSSSKQLDAADMSFVDYVDSLRIPYEKIQLATNNFTHANLLPTQSPSSSSFPKLIYTGQLEQSGGQLLDIVARKIPKAQDNIVFNELVTSHLLKHKNIHSIFKICDTDEPIIISKYEANGSLDKLLSNSTLTWMQRLHICVGVAHALSYIHDYDAEGGFSVIHGNIKSSKILLDENWEPKLNCFGFSMFVKKHQPHLTSKYNGTLQYVDPESVNIMTHKSDVFSFGVVLFEVLFGEIASIKDEDNWYFAGLARSVYEEKTLDDMIDADLHQQMDRQSLKIFSEAAYFCLKEVSSERPDMVQIVKKLETALVHQQKHDTLVMSLRNDLAHLKIPLENILSATNDFADKNVIAGAGAGVRKEYEGQLLWSGELISIAAMRLKKERNQGELQFLMEISMLSNLKHKNLISIVGFCDEYGEKIIIHEHEARGRLSDYLSDPALLPWVRRLEICVSLSHVLSYIYYDEARDFSVIHRNITSNTIHLNNYWEPKLSDFKLSITIRASERHQSIHADTVWYPEGYTDPTYIETEEAHHKSDMYSFGIVMFELLCGRKSVIANDYNKYLAPAAITHYREKKLNEIIDWGLLKQIDSQSLNIFAETAYDCLNEERSKCPNIDEIVTRLEKALELQLESQKAEQSMVAAELEGTSSNYEKVMSLRNNLAHLKIPLENILSATNNFSDENVITGGGVGKEYKGQLLWSRELISIAAMRLNKERNQGELQFLMEISMLSNLKHKNLISIVGFCDENGEKIIIRKHEAKGRLGEYLSDPMLLTWMRRLEICVGLSHVLSYIYYDEARDFSVIHRNITSNTIILNDDWEPKLSDFELSIAIRASERHQSIDADTVWYPEGYKDPSYIETESAHHKSDIYSFGIVLFEVVCGRKSIIANENYTDLASAATFHYIAKKLDYIIDPDLFKQMDPQSFNIFAETAYDCLNEERSKRPNIDEIVTRLEKALELQLESQKAEQSMVAAELEGTSSNYEKVTEILEGWKTSPMKFKAFIYKSSLLITQTCQNTRKHKDKES